MKEKHVIVCISNASDHQKAICLAADMAALLNARFSAVVADNAILREHSGMKKKHCPSRKKRRTNYYADRTRLCASKC